MVMAAIVLACIAAVLNAGSAGPRRDWPDDA